MIKKEDYEKAFATVQAYNEQLNLHIVSHRTCCKCEKKVIKPLHSERIKPLTQECGMWDDGVVEKITFGYGSRHDMDSYYVAICDECITDLKDRGFATNLRDIKKELKSYGG
jgi:hypothetical protein